MAPPTSPSRSRRFIGRSTSESRSSIPLTCTGRSRTNSSSAAPSKTGVATWLSPPSSATNAAPTEATWESTAGSVRPPRVRRLAQAAGDRSDRSLLSASRRYDGRDRRHRRRDGRPRQPGQSQVPRSVRSGARDDPPRACCSPDQRAADRVFTLDERRRGERRPIPSASWASDSLRIARSDAAF